MVRRGGAGAGEAARLCLAEDAAEADCLRSGGSPDDDDEEDAVAEGNAMETGGVAADVDVVADSMGGRLV